MKYLIAVSAVLSLTGCAATQSTTQAPYYDESQQALIGVGYPVPFIKPLSNFNLVKKYDDSRAQPGSRVINSREIGATWIDEDDLTAVATAFYQGLDAGYEWGQGSKIDGVDRVGGIRFEYAAGNGFYQDVTGDVDFLPDGAPACAHSVALISYSDDRSKRMLLTYTEGLAYCGIRLIINDEEDDKLRERAYQAFGLR